MFHVNCFSVENIFSGKHFTLQCLVAFYFKKMFPKIIINYLNQCKMKIFIFFYEKLNDQNIPRTSKMTKIQSIYSGHFGDLNILYILKVYGYFYHLDVQRSNSISTILEFLIVFGYFFFFYLGGGLTHLSISRVYWRSFWRFWGCFFYQYKCFRGILIILKVLGDILIILEFLVVFG